MRFLAVLTLCLALTCATARDCGGGRWPVFTGNASLINGDDFGFRATSAFAFNIPILGGMGFFNSFQVDASGTGVQLDAVSNRVFAAFGSHPVVSVAYFDNSNNFNASEFDPSDFTRDLNAGVYASVISTVFTRVIEFQDENDNQQFDPEVDTVVKAIDLSTQTWDTLCLSSTDPNDPLKTFNASTSKPLLPLNEYVAFTLQTQFSSVVGVNQDGQIVTPRSAKIDIGVGDFPFAEQGSYLALESIVISASASADFNLSMSVSGNTVKAGQGHQQVYFDWVKSAQVDGAQAAVKASALYQADSSKIRGLSASIFINGNAKANKDYQFVYFSFNQTNPSYVYWDPAVGTGRQPQTVDDSDDNNGGGSSAIALGLGVGAGVLVVAAGAFWCLRRRGGSAGEKTSLLPTRG